MDLGRALCVVRAKKMAMGCAQHIFTDIHTFYALQYLDLCKPIEVWMILIQGGNYMLSSAVLFQSHSINL